MPDCLQFCKIIMFADDARVFLNGQCDNVYEKMLGDLEITMQWSTIWQLELVFCILDIGTRALIIF